MYSFTEPQRKHKQTSVDVHYMVALRAVEYTYTHSYLYLSAYPCPCSQPDSKEDST